MNEKTVEQFKRGHKFEMPDTWIWVDVLDTVNFEKTDDSYGIGKRVNKDVPCLCILLGEYQDNFILKYKGHNGFFARGTSAPDGIVFILPQKVVLNWANGIIEQDKQKKSLKMALKEALTQ